jgi:aspartate/methionine/tyrosine aminotransferase
VEAAAKAMRDGLTAYTPALGIPELREAIAGFYADATAWTFRHRESQSPAGASGRSC